MDMTHRCIVEATKQAKDIEIVLNPGDRNNRVAIKPKYNKKLMHDIALSLQAFFIEQEKLNVKNYG